MAEKTGRQQQPLHLRAGSLWLAPMPPPRAGAHRLGVEHEWLSALCRAPSSPKRTCSPWLEWEPSIPQDDELKPTVKGLG
jgi:hypothetical protein